MRARPLRKRRKRRSSRRQQQSIGSWHLHAQLGAVEPLTIGVTSRPLEQHRRILLHHAFIRRFAVDRYGHRLIESNRIGRQQQRELADAAALRLESIPLPLDVDAPGWTTVIEDVEVLEARIA